MTAALHSPVRRASVFLGGNRKDRRQRKSKINGRVESSDVITKKSNATSKEEGVKDPDSSLSSSSCYPRNHLDDSEASLDLFSFVDDSEDNAQTANRGNGERSWDPFESVDNHNGSLVNNNSLSLSNHSSTFLHNSSLSRSSLVADGRDTRRSSSSPCCVPAVISSTRKAPPKEKTNTGSNAASFKMDGVPACVCQQMEENSKKNKKIKKKKKSIVTMADLHDSVSSLNPNDRRIKKQRPTIKFLDLPKDHPLYWDKQELKSVDFPEADRDFLAKILKNPKSSSSTTTTTKKKIQLSNRMEQILLKLHTCDWDAAILGRSAMFLFHPDSNPLGLSPIVTSYFYKRINLLKTNILQMRATEEEVTPAIINNTPNVIEYRGKSFRNEESLIEFATLLRKDFEEATRNYEIYKNIVY